MRMSACFRLAEKSEQRLLGLLDALEGDVADLVQHRVLVDERADRGGQRLPVLIDREQLEAQLVDGLDDDEDVQVVFSNANISDEIMAKLNAE